MKNDYSLSMVPKLIYVMRINDKAHKGCLKVGDIYDSWDSSNQLVKSVCTVKEEKQNRKQDLNFKEICEELCNKGSEVVKDIIKGK